MKKNTYLGLILTVCLSITAAPLLAEVSPAPEHPVTSAAPRTSDTETKYPSELQREKVEHNKANITAPATSVSEPNYPSELHREKTEHDKTIAK